jgi:hypothetical protein
MVTSSPLARSQYPARRKIRSSTTSTSCREIVRPATGCRTHKDPRCQFPNSTSMTAHTTWWAAARCAGWRSAGRGVYQPQGGRLGRLREHNGGQQSLFRVVAMRQQPTPSQFVELLVEIPLGAAEPPAVEVLFADITESGERAGSQWGSRPCRRLTGSPGRLQRQNSGRISRKA